MQIDYFLNDRDPEGRTEYECKFLMDSVDAVIKAYTPRNNSDWNDNCVANRSWPMFGYLTRFVHNTCDGFFDAGNKCRRGDRENEYIRHMPETESLDENRCAHCGFQGNLDTDLYANCKQCLRARAYFWKCSDLACEPGAFNVEGVDSHCYWCRRPKPRRYFSQVLLCDIYSNMHYLTSTYLLLLFALGIAQPS
jgi:hypothetical protein